MPRQFKVTVNGREYEVSVLELTGGQSAASAPAPAAHHAAPVAGSAPVLAAPSAPASASAPAAGSGDVVAGMGGVVVEVDVKVGQNIAAGDRLLVLEAMKMKTPIVATRGGQVTRVMVAPGEAVEGGQPLLTIA